MRSEGGRDHDDARPRPEATATIRSTALSTGRRTTTPSASIATVRSDVTLSTTTGTNGGCRATNPSARKSSLPRAPPPLGQGRIADAMGGARPPQPKSPAQSSPRQSAPSHRPASVAWGPAQTEPGAAPSEAGISTEATATPSPDAKIESVIAISPVWLVVKAESQPRNQIRWKYGGPIPLTLSRADSPRLTPRSVLAACARMPAERPARASILCATLLPVDAA